MSQQSPSFDARFGTIISTVDDEKQISSLDRLNRESYPSELCNDDLFADGEKFTEIEGSNEKIHAVNLDQPSSTASVDTSNDSGSDSESDTDKMNASVHERPLHLSDDGRTLSAYEMQRLERIKRNRDYLAQLGLEDKGKNSQPEQSKSHQKIKKDESRPVPTRAIISRRSKAKPIRYAEPSNSVRDLLNDKVDGISLNLADTSAASLPVIPIDAVNNTKSEPTSDTMPCETNVLLNESSEKAGLIELGSVHQRQNNKTEKRKHERMEHFVYKEFCRLKSHKNQVLKDVEKLHRASEKEVRLWKGKWDKWNVKWKRRQLRLEMEREEKLEAEQRRLLMESVAKKMDHEKKVLGCTINRLLHDTDSRMPEILRAVKQYDDQKEVRFSRYFELTTIKLTNTNLIIESRN